MITMTFTDVRQNFASVLDKALEQPVTISRRSAPDMVIISAEQFADLQQAKFESSLVRVMSKPDSRSLFEELADK